MNAVPPSASATTASPCLSRHDKTSPWPLTPPAGRFVDVSGPPSSPSRYVQPHLLHYLIQQQHPATGRTSSRPSAGSNYQASSSPGSSTMFYHVDHGRAGVTQQLPAGAPASYQAISHVSHSAGPPVSYQASSAPSAVRWTDWRCGLRPSGAVSFRAVVDGDDGRSSATDHSSQPQHKTTHAAGAYQNNRLI